MIVDFVQNCVRRGVASHWELTTERRSAPVAGVEMDVFRLYLSDNCDVACACRLMDEAARYRHVGLHRAHYVPGTQPYISVPLG